MHPHGIAQKSNLSGRRNSKFGRTSDSICGFRIPASGADEKRTCLSARVVEGGRRLDGHRVDGTVADLGAGIASSARPRHLLRLGRLSAEVAAAHHLLRGGLAPESAGYQDLFRRRRLSPVTKTKSISKRRTTAANQIRRFHDNTNFNSKNFIQNFTDSAKICRNFNTFGY